MAPGDINRAAQRFKKGQGDSNFKIVLENAYRIHAKRKENLLVKDKELPKVGKVCLTGRKTHSYHQRRGHSATEVHLMTGLASILNRTGLPLSPSSSRMYIKNQESGVSPGQTR